MNAGRFLRDCRLKANMKQADLAAVLNVGQSDISKIERCEKEPSLSQYRDWTFETQSVELGIAFLYGTEVLSMLPDIVNTISNAVAGAINLLGGFM